MASKVFCGGLAALTFYGLDHFGIDVPTAKLAAGAVALVAFVALVIVGIRKR